MKPMLFVVLGCLTLFLTGCSSLECEITRCGQKCQPSDCHSQCPQCACNLCKYHAAARYANNGAADFDTYHVVKPVVHPCYRRVWYK